MDNQDEEFEVTAEMLIHGDLDDESTLSDEEDIEEEDSDEIDELQTEGDLPLEDLLARYGYGAGSGPSGVRSGDSDSGEDEESVGGEDSSNDELEGPSNNPVTTGDVTKDKPAQRETGQTSSSSSESKNSKVEIEQSAPIQKGSSTSASEESSMKPGPSADGQRSSNHLKSNQEAEKEGKSSILGKRRGEDPVINDVPLSSKHPAIMTETDEATNSSHWIRSGRLRSERKSRVMAEGNAVDAYFNSLLEDSDLSDDEFMPIFREDWKQEIKVGSRYQAIVPDFPNGVAPPTSYVATPTGELVWRPRESSERAVSQFLESLSQTVSDTRCDSERDSEEVLEVLQSCDHNVSTALQRILTRGLPKREMEPWTENECQSFEEGMKQHGKDFFRVQKQVPTRTVKELVEFYYLWKKSERYDLFIQRYGKIGKKKIVVPPGHVSDFMCKYFDIYSTDTPDIHYAATTISAEAKRDNT